MKNIHNPVPSPRQQLLDQIAISRAKIDYNARLQALAPKPPAKIRFSARRLAWQMTLKAQLAKLEIFNAAAVSESTLTR